MCVSMPIPIFPKKFFDKMLEVASQYRDMGKRVRAIPPLYDSIWRIWCRFRG